MKCLSNCPLNPYNSTFLMINQTCLSEECSVFIKDLPAQKFEGNQLSSAIKEYMDCLKVWSSTKDAAEFQSCNKEAVVRLKEKYSYLEN